MINLWVWLKLFLGLIRPLTAHVTSVKMTCSLTTHGALCSDRSVSEDSLALVTSRSESAGWGSTHQDMKGGLTSHALLSQPGFTSTSCRFTQKGFIRARTRRRFIDDWAIRLLRNGPGGSAWGVNKTGFLKWGKSVWEFVHETLLFLEGFHWQMTWHLDGVYNTTYQMFSHCEVPHAVA